MIFGRYLWQRRKCVRPNLTRKLLMLLVFIGPILPPSYCGMYIHAEPLLFPDRLKKGFSRRSLYRTHIEVVESFYQKYTGG